MAHAGAHEAVRGWRQCGLTIRVRQPKLTAMSGGVQLAEQAGSKDPAVGLCAVAALRELADRLEVLQVANARKQGWSWQHIADCIGLSRQAVHKKHGTPRRILGRS